MVQKTDDITATLVQGVIASCNCRLNSTFLFNAFLKCFADSSQHVTYRATLLSSSDLSTSKVLEYNYREMDSFHFKCDYSES